MTFEFYPLRFEFVARDSVHFPAGKAANIIRGAFGSILVRECQRTKVFAPVSGDWPGGLPSGLADPPRPFVFRASHLDGRTFAPGQSFHFDVHLFDVRELPYFTATFARLAIEGLGPRRGRVEIVASDPPRIMTLSLNAEEDDVPRATVQFRTPTELKAGSKLVEKPEFGVLFARIRDRISMLRSVYGAGPLEIDYRAMGERAARVRMIRCELRRVEAERRSSRTGQTHSIGGFVGQCEYEGDLREFMPYLRVAKWTGVGRQTVWGKGEIETTV